MSYSRIFAVVGSLFIAIGCCLPASLSKFQLPGARFMDWVVVKNDCSDTAVNQIWRKNLTELPKGTDGYLMVSYQVTTVDSATEAQRAADKLLQRDQFNSYLGRGYSLASTPWTVHGEQGVLFMLSGLSQSDTAARAQAAHIYTYAMAKDANVIWLQVREVSTAAELKLTDKVFRRANARPIADEMASYLIEQWLPRPSAPITPPVKIEITPDPTPVIPTPNTPNTHPDATVTGTPPTPPAETPLPILPLDPKNHDTLPPKEDGPRWATSDKLFSLALPAGWRASDKTTPYRITGVAGVNVVIYPSDPYTTTTERDRAISKAVAAQQDIALAAFTQSPFTVDQATGATVQYTNYQHNTTVCYFVAKSGHFWRIDVNLPGEGSSLPDAAQRMIASIRLR